MTKQTPEPGWLNANAQIAKANREMLAALELILPRLDLALANDHATGHQSGITHEHAETVRRVLAACKDLLDADEAIIQNIGTKSDQAMNRIAAIDNARAVISESITI